MVGLLVGAAIAAAIILKKKQNGVGAVSADAIDWGANELYLWVLNTEWMYTAAKEKILRMYEHGYDKEAIIYGIKIFLYKRIIPYVPKSRGMSFGEKARQKAAEDIVDALTEEIEF